MLASKLTFNILTCDVNCTHLLSSHPQRFSAHHLTFRTFRLPHIMQVLFPQDLASLSTFKSFGISLSYISPVVKSPVKSCHGRPRPIPSVCGHSISRFIFLSPPLSAAVVPASTALHFGFFWITASTLCSLQHLLTNTLTSTSVPWFVSQVYAPYKSTAFTFDIEILKLVTWSTISPSPCLVPTRIRISFVFVALILTPPFRGTQLQCPSKYIENTF